MKFWMLNLVKMCSITEIFGSRVVNQSQLFCFYEKRVSSYIWFFRWE